jgi:hypothetical protein
MLGMGPDFALRPLHGDARFESLVTDAQRRIAVTRKPTLISPHCFGTGKVGSSTRRGPLASPVLYNGQAK